MTKVNLSEADFNTNRSYFDVGEYTVGIDKVTHNTDDKGRDYVQ